MTGGTTTGGDETGGNTTGDKTGGDETRRNTTGDKTGGDETGSNTTGDKTGGDETGSNTTGDKTGGDETGGGWPCMPLCRDAALVLEDGSVFYGYGAGAAGMTLGELCFTTTMTGFQETLTDPCYHRQLVVFTFPHIGIVGANPQDHEHMTGTALGCVTACRITEASNYRSEHAFADWLTRKNMIAVQDVDTRYLTHRLREDGAMTAGLVYRPAVHLPATDLSGLISAVKQFEGISHSDLTPEVSCPDAQDFAALHSEAGPWQLTMSGYRPVPVAAYHVVAIDYGAKSMMFRYLSALGARVTIVPASTPARDIIALRPDGLFLSNGPGNPETGVGAVAVLKTLLAATRIPVFGICLGHQLLALALGGRTIKMHTGHRGANHPVIDLTSGRVSITSQNHGYAVVADSLCAALPGQVIITHQSLFDGTVEGFALRDRPLFAVQYHPEASPGPHDAFPLFEQFDQMIRASLHQAAS